VPLAAGVVIGRSPQAPSGKPDAVPIAYPDNEMSKTHAFVELADSGITVTDLHSTNGTAVANNGNLVICEPGQRVTMGATATIHAGSSQITVTELA
jgi:hypothetical protein